MGLPDKVEESVLREATRNSTKNHLVESGSSRKNKSKRRSTRGRKEPGLDLSDSQQSDEPRKTQPIATSENGIETNRIPEDINKEVRQELTRSGLLAPHLRVRFEDTPVFIEPERKVDDYDIVQDIKD